MSNIFEDLTLNSSIDDILEYVVPEKRLKSKEKEVKRPSFLEKLLEPEKIVKKFERLESLVEESNNLPQEHIPAVVSYDLFIPTEKIVYSGSIKYVSRFGGDEIMLKGDNKDVSIVKDKENESEYAILFDYDSKKQGYNVKYITTAYKDNLEKARQDFTGRLDKALEILPTSLMGGVLGFTYIGSGKMARRADLTGDTANMVDVHEAIHTPDEYETRVLTSWMLTREKPKYKR